MDEEEEPHTAGVVDPVEEQLPEPLLVDPAPAVRPECQDVAVRQSVPCEESSGDEGQPGVRADLDGRAKAEDQRVERNDDEDERLSCERLDETVARAAGSRRHGVGRQAVLHGCQPVGGAVHHLDQIAQPPGAAGLRKPRFARAVRLNPFPPRNA